MSDGILQIDLGAFAPNPYFTRIERFHEFGGFAHGLAVVAADGNRRAPCAIEQFHELNGFPKSVGSHVVHRHNCSLRTASFV